MKKINLYSEEFDELKINLNASIEHVVKKLASKEFEKSKQIKQRTFFASICILADKAKEVTTLAGGKYKQVVLNFTKEVLEELEEWSKWNECS